MYNTIVIYGDGSFIALKNGVYYHRSFPLRKPFKIASMNQILLTFFESSLIGLLLLFVFLFLYLQIYLR